MFEALIVTLREGIEAALVVGIIVAFLRREGREAYLGAVWAGISSATAASLIGAFVLYRWEVNEEVLGGLLYLVSAVIVATMMIWMWRHSHSISGEMKGSLLRILERESGASIRAGLFTFTFFMVFREGIETVLFLSALSLSSGALLTLLGVGVGLTLAVAFGVFFVRGSVRIDLGRFFKITGIALGIFIVQLLVNGYHELAEAGWMPANERSMAVIGPLVKDEFFFVAAVVLLPLLMLLVPGGRRTAPIAPAPTAPAPAAPREEAGAGGRLERAQGRREARARLLGGTLGAAILAVLGLGFVYTRPAAVLSPATPVSAGQDGEVHIPLATLRGSATLHRYLATVPGAAAGVRFIAVPLDAQARAIATAFDACEICGSKGYYQEGPNITCLHCGSAIYPPSIGQHGGCNPIPLPSKIAGTDLVIAAADLVRGAALFAPAPGGGGAGQGAPAAGAPAGMPMSHHGH